MASTFARDLATVEGAELVAVGSRTANAAQALAEERGAGRAHGSYAALAADPDIDIVYIATPHNVHAENSLMCLKAGKAVLCEKPFSINALEAERVIQCARAHNLFLMEAMWTRFLPAMNKVRELIDAGKIGNITHVTAGGGFVPAYDPRHYLFDKNRGGGVLLDAGVYLINVTMMLLGVPSKICALGHIGEHGIDDSIGIMLGYNNGSQASLHLSLKHQESPTAKVFGERGRIDIHAPVFAPSAITLAPYEGEEQTFSFETGAGYSFQAAEANRCLRAGLVESPVMTWQHTLDVMTTMDEARRQIGIKYSADNF